MSQYQKECIFCKTKIEKSDKGGKWLPYNLDEKQTLYECKKNGNGHKNGNGTDISVEVLLKRLEQLGIKVDLEKIRSMK